jgi:hypothetical protein
MATAATHSQLIAGAGQTAAGTIVLGNITLAAGDQWLVHHVYGLVVPATATAGEAVGGFFSFNAVSGDLTPAPLPNQWPLWCAGSALGATIDQAFCPVHLYPTAWQATGKAVIEVSFTQDTANTAAPQLVVGLMYGANRPEMVPFVHCQRARAAVTSAADTSLGTITLPENAKRIIGISCSAIQDNVLTAGEELIGFMRFTSDDQELQPLQLPLVMAYGAGLGALITGPTPNNPIVFNTDIPVLGGSRINCFVDLNTAVTNAAECVATIYFE